MGSLSILYEDNHLLVVNKPAGLATMGTSPGVPSVHGLACAYLKTKYQKPGNVYLGIVSRLDAPVTGVLLLARTSKAASRLTDAFRRRLVRKEYWAVVSPPVAAESARWVDWLRKDESARRMVLCGEATPGAQRAELSYEQLARQQQRSWLRVRLETGRKHQIRVQLAGRGFPIVGDARYGSRQTFPHGIALHARSLSLSHPVGGAALQFVAPVPGYWPRT